MAVQRQCCVCHRIWVPLDLSGGAGVWQSAPYLQQASHGYCPECFRRELLRARQALTALQVRHNR